MSVPCVGWQGPCDRWGIMHGCQLEDGHPGGWHTCSCGARIKAARRSQPAARVAHWRGKGWAG